MPQNRNADTPTIPSAQPPSCQEDEEGFGGVLPVAPPARAHLWLSGRLAPQRRLRARHTVGA